MAESGTDAPLAVVTWRSATSSTEARYEPADCTITSYALPPSVKSFTYTLASLFWSMAKTALGETPRISAFLRSRVRRSCGVSARKVFITMAASGRAET